MLRPRSVTSKPADLPADLRARLARTARRALAALGRAGGHVDVALVDDREIRALNARYRGVRRRTDVLAFPMDSPLVGQVIVSVETAGRQACQLDVPVELELDLLVTHGVLHLVGYDDRDPVEGRLMHQREREILGRRAPDRLWTGLLDLERSEPRDERASAKSQILRPE